MHRPLLVRLILQLLTMCRVSDVVWVTLDTPTTGVAVRVSAEVCSQWQLLWLVELASLQHR